MNGYGCTNAMRKSEKRFFLPTKNSARKTFFKAIEIRKKDQN
jgi:hypothetical protein